MFDFNSLPSPSFASALLQQIPESSRISQPQLSVSLNVIPDEDSQREVEAATDQPEDDYSGLMEDGLGGGGGDGDDFIDDERNDAGANTQDRFALPPWLSVAFKA